METKGDTDQLDDCWLINGRRSCMAEDTWCRKKLVPRRSSVGSSLASRSRTVTRWRSEFVESWWTCWRWASCSLEEIRARRRWPWIEGCDAKDECLNIALTPWWQTSGESRKTKIHTGARSLREEYFSVWLTKRKRSGEGMKTNYEIQESEVSQVISSRDCSLKERIGR